MCGIVGIAGPHDVAWVEGMNACQAHRGPDDAGVRHDPDAGVTLAMRRLSIVDLAGGHQPMSNETGSVWIVHNGEVFNAPELRRELQAAGHVFRTSHSDTEVLVHLYEEYGEGMVERLEGMYAFVLHDADRGRVFGARDRLGIKPLYYLHEEGRLAFASELKSLLQLPFVRRDLDLDSVGHYMRLLYVPGERSIFQQVRRLLPAHSFTLDLKTGALVTRRYWDVPLGPYEDRTEEEWCTLIREGLRKAVLRWSTSDVPIGCSLSGGIDSSAVVALLREGGHDDVRTFSLGFEGPEGREIDELDLAREVAERWGSEHHDRRLSPETLLRDLARMVWHLDEPYGGGIPSWYVFEFMREEVTVAMTGSGGDELFGNYEKWHVYEGSLPGRIGGALRAVPVLARMAAATVPPVGARLRRARQVIRDTGSAARPAAYLTTWYPRTLGEDLLLSPTESTRDLLLERARKAADADPRDAVAYLDLRSQLPDEFLHMTDRFSMAHSIEARVPFLDHHFVELVMRIPPGVRTRAGDPKYLLKRALRDLLPPEVLEGRKRGFVVPVAAWLRGPLRPLAERLMAHERLERQGIFRPNFAHRYLDPHLRQEADNADVLWAMLMFQLWHVVFIERAATEEPRGPWEEIVP